MSFSNSSSSSDKNPDQIEILTSEELDRQDLSSKRVSEKQDDHFCFQPTKSFRANIRQAPKGIIIDKIPLA